MKILPTLGLAGCCVLLHACIFAPGQTMNTQALEDKQSQVGSRYQLVPITPKLIAMDRASAAQVQIDPALLAYQPHDYRIGAGDSLYITVWDHPELTSPAGMQQQTAANGRLVRPDGTLFYPYVGLLKVEGMTVEQLRQAISERLTKYVEKPQVDIAIVGYGSQRISLAGAFNKTTPQDISILPTTLGQAIGAAGINATLADLSDVVLTRDGRQYHLDLDAISRDPKALPNIYLKGGDRIYLPYNDRHEAYVLGEVNQPKAIAFKTSDLTLTQALSRADGLSQTTSKGKAIYVIRGVDDMEKAPATIFQLDAKSPSAFALGQQFSVKPGDVVFVGPADVTRWNRFLSQLLPLSSLVNSTVTSRYDIDQSN